MEEGGEGGQIRCSLRWEQEFSKVFYIIFACRNMWVYFLKIHTKLVIDSEISD